MFVSKMHINPLTFKRTKVGQLFSVNKEIFLELSFKFFPKFIFAKSFYDFPQEYGET
jgi:hypothetical protein